MKLKILLLFVLVCSACVRNNEEEDALLGHWEVQWVDKSKLVSNLPGVDYQVMHGIINFRDDGKAEMKAFGYRGCVFLQDTTMHVVNWDLKNDNLNLSDDDKFYLTYKVVDIKPDAINCQILDDIEIRLTKN